MKELISVKPPEVGGGCVYISDPVDLNIFGRICNIHCPAKYRGEVVLKDTETGAITFHPSFSTAWYSALKRLGHRGIFTRQGIILFPAGAEQLFKQIEDAITILPVIPDNPS